MVKLKIKPILNIDHINSMIGSASGPFEKAMVKNIAPKKLRQHLREIFNAITDIDNLELQQKAQGHLFLIQEWMGREADFDKACARKETLSKNIDKLDDIAATLENKIHHQAMSAAINNTRTQMHTLDLL
jgi:hypothetical protein